MKYLVLVNTQGLRKLKISEDYGDIFLVKEEDEEKFMKDLIDLHDNLVENKDLLTQ